MLSNKMCTVMQEASDAHSKTADSDTVSTYQVSSVQVYVLHTKYRRSFSCMSQSSDELIDIPSYGNCKKYAPR